jgi:hypothetical protein
MIRKLRTAPMLLACLVSLLPGSLAAQRVLAPGREADVLALFAPHELGDEVVPGFRLDGVAIQARVIELTLEPIASGSAQRVQLLPAPPAPTEAQDAQQQDAQSAAGSAEGAQATPPGASARTPSFEIRSEGRGDTQTGIVTALAALVEPNDGGGFWVEVAEDPSTLAPPESPTGPTSRPWRLFVWGILLAFTLWLLVRRGRARTEPNAPADAPKEP